MDYDELDALNWSTLKRLHVSALYYRWCLENPEPPKPAYLLGSAIHCATLEPEKFADRYALCTITRNKRHGAYQDWLAEHDGKTPLNQDEFDRARNAAEAVHSHRVARETMSGVRHEEPMTWTDPDTGLKCKGRVDVITPARVIDLKMARNISPRMFGRAAAEYLYHGQVCGMYHAGAVALKKIDGKTPPLIVAVEPLPPHDVAVYEFSLEDIAAGRQLVVSLMQKLEACITSDLWPGRVPDLRQLELPAWAPGFESDESEEW